MNNVIYQRDEVISAVAGMWPQAIGIISGIPASVFNKRHQACPSCGGKDRFRYDDYLENQGDGGYICGQCGSGDGLNLLMKVSGMSYFEAINSLGEWVGGVPVQRREAVRAEVIQRASQEKYGQYSTHERCVQILDSALIKNKTPVTLSAGISPEAVHTLISSSDIELVCVSVALCGTTDTLCDIAFINPFHEVKFLSRGFPASGVSIIPGEGKAIYLCADWFDSWHTHHATGAEVWCCWSPENMAQVAHRMKGKPFRVACHQDDRESLIQADEAGLQVIVPRSGKWSMGMERKLYNPADLL